MVTLGELVKVFKSLQKPIPAIFDEPLCITFKDVDHCDWFYKDLIHYGCSMCDYLEDTCEYQFDGTPTHQPLSEKEHKIAGSGSAYIWKFLMGQIEIEIVPLELRSEKTELTIELRNKKDYCIFLEALYTGTKMAELIYAKAYKTPESAAEGFAAAQLWRDYDKLLSPIIHRKTTEN